MKARVLVDGGAPKVPPEELMEVLRRAGIEVSNRGADFGVVVGGDGKFSRYGRTEEIPLLFVGVRSKDVTGSRAYLAETTIDELPQALERIRSGDYSIDEHHRLAVSKNGRSLGEVFTDVYLQRGSESTCIRYNLRIEGRLDIDESAIGDGVVVTTRAGSTGYYSYPDRIKGDRMDPSASTEIREDEVGVCHINPTYTQRTGTLRHPLRYTVPWGSKIAITLFREADARLYGTADEREGVRITRRDKVVVVPGRSVTRVLTLGSGRASKPG